MTAARDLAAYLVSQGLATGLYQDLWLNELPATPDDVASLFDYGGLADTHVVGEPLPDTERPRVQILERAAVSFDAEQRITAKSLALASIADQDIAGVRYRRVTRVQAPFLLGRDENERFEWACNVQVEKARI